MLRQQIHVWQVELYWLLCYNIVMYRGFETDTHRAPQTALVSIFSGLNSEVSSMGCSQHRRAPINQDLKTAYEAYGEKPKLSDVIDYDPLEVIPSALSVVFKGGKVSRYDRTFRPGESEGTHTDPHDVVLTYTQSGDALFTIDSAANRTHILGRHMLVMFNGRLPHEVSAPLGHGYRTITAFGIDL